MKYSEQEQTPEEIDSRPRYSTDQTAFMRWSTEIEPDKDIIVDQNFIRRFAYKILGLNKFPALANIQTRHQMQLIRCRRNNAKLEWGAGLFDSAMETTLDNLEDYNVSRGIHGFYQKALITQRREWTDKTPQAGKTGIMGRLIGGSKEQDKSQMLTEEEP